MGRLEVGGSVRGRCRGPQGRLDRCLNLPVSWPLKMDGPSAYSHMLRLTVSEVVAILSTEESLGIGRADECRSRPCLGRSIPSHLAHNDQRQRQGVSFLSVVGDGSVRFLPPRRATLQRGQAFAAERGADGILLDHELEFEMLLGVTNCSAVSTKANTLTPSRPSRPYFARH